MFDFGDLEEPCDKCRNCGVFPGDGGWAYCICPAGYERALAEDDEIQPPAVDPHDVTVVAYLHALESGTFLVGQASDRSSRSELEDAAVKRTHA